MPYLMESRDEAARLELKTDRTFTVDNLQRAGLKSGMKALDVGCGSGAVTRVMGGIALREPYGIDLSVDRLAAARALATECSVRPAFICASADSMPFTPDSFDFVWSRFLFEYARAPTAILEEMIRVARPGGIVAVADLDAQMTQFYPKPDELGRKLDQAIAILSKFGFDPVVGRKLYKWFVDAGLREVRVQVFPYQNYFGGLTGAALANWKQKVATIGETMRRVDPDGSWEPFGIEFLAHMTRPDLCYYTTMILVTGIKADWPQP